MAHSATSPVLENGFAQSRSRQVAQTCERETPPSPTGTRREAQAFEDPGSNPGAATILAEGSTLFQMLRNPGPADCHRETGTMVRGSEQTESWVTVYHSKRVQLSHCPPRSWAASVSERTAGLHPAREGLIPSRSTSGAVVQRKDSRLSIGRCEFNSRQRYHVVLLRGLLERDDGLITRSERLQVPPPLPRSTSSWGRAAGLHPARARFESLVDHQPLEA